MQVQQRQHLGDLRGLTAPGRQDRRAEPHPLPGVGIDPAVIDPRRAHLDRARRGEHLPGLVGAVAHDQSTPALVALVQVAGDVVLDLGLQGLGQHPPGALPHELVDQGHTAQFAGVIGAGSSRNYGEHGSYLPDRRWPRRPCLRTVRMIGRVRPSSVIHRHPIFLAVKPQLL
jgi:hypothetical protein